MVRMQDSIDVTAYTPDYWLANEKECNEMLLKLSSWEKIPLLNSNASHHLPDNSLVRFKGMVQDMHNPEFYFESFQVYNTVTNQTKTKSGKYRDSADVLENEKINYTENLVSGQRQTMVMVSIPGLSEWVVRIEDAENHLPHLSHQPTTSRREHTNQPTSLKRTFQQDEETMDVEGVVCNKEPKINETVKNPTNVVSREHLLNFPLPDVASQSCIIKLYCEDESIKINDMLEVVGFLSVSPCLSGEFVRGSVGELGELGELVDPTMETEVELLTHHPPPSLVPRLHAVKVRKCEHCNPLVKDFNQESSLRVAGVAREHLLKALTELLLGDSLAAHYLVCHLIGNVYLRTETMALGQFCLNISNLPTAKYPKYAQQLSDIIRQFVTKSYYLPLTIDNLNTMAFIPKKDYECNRLTSGIFQLSKNTHLICDETRMEQGTLGPTGVHNITALGNLIQSQKVEYDFKYYKMDFDTDISVLVLSEGRSLLPSSYHVPLKPEESSLEMFDAIVEAATYYLKEDIMNTIRVYLTTLQLVKFTINDDLKFVEDDFIEMRKKSTTDNPITEFDLHRLLVLARLVSLSRGFDSLNKECWDTAVQMEAERNERVKNRVAPTV